MTDHLTPPQHLIDEGARLVAALTAMSDQVERLCSEVDDFITRSNSAFPEIPGENFEDEDQRGAKWDAACGVDRMHDLLRPMARQAIGILGGVPVDAY